MYNRNYIGHAHRPDRFSMDLTLVVVCRDDPRVFNLLDSRDIDVPTIVSIVPNQRLESRLEERGVTVIRSIPGNVSVSYNRGIIAARTSRVFLVDSDCTLNPGCLELISRLLDDAFIARAFVKFESSPSVFLSQYTARMRHSHNNRTPIPAYTPGLALRKEVATRLGGYYFDERIFWACDSEFGHRVSKARIQIAYSSEAVITHSPISLYHEMRSAFRLGMGNREQVRFGLRLSYEGPIALFKHAIGWIILWPRSVRYWLNDPVFSTMQRAWFIMFIAGYYWALILDCLKSLLQLSSVKLQC